MAGIHSVVGLREVPGAAAIELHDLLVAATHDHHRCRRWERQPNEISDALDEVGVSPLVVSRVTLSVGEGKLGWFER